MQAERDRFSRRHAVRKPDTGIRISNTSLDLEREKHERKDAELSVAALERRLTSLQDKCIAIQGEIDQYRTITTNLGRGV